MQIINEYFLFTPTHLFSFHPFVIWFFQLHTDSTPPLALPVPWLSPFHSHSYLLWLSPPQFFAIPGIPHTPGSPFILGFPRTTCFLLFLVPPYFCFSHPYLPATLGAPFPAYLVLPSLAPSLLAFSHPLAFLMSCLFLSLIN